MKKQFLTITIVLLVTAISAQVTDIDGNTYKTVKIGEQEWMAENLTVSVFLNGDTIPEAKTKQEWLSAAIHGQPAWCYYNNDKKNGKTYGKLYNWYAVNDPRGLAPEEWKVPDKEDWLTMLFKLGSPAAAGTQLKSTSLWKEPFKKEDKGNNKSGFNALPAGHRAKDGNFRDLTTNTYFWTSTGSEKNKEHAYYRSLSYISQAAIETVFEKGRGYSVRCVKQ
jgi:uncharacterized protein (TIGR02145 family)